MRTSPLAPALLGKRLARSVYDRHGRVLLAAGTQVTEKHLDALSRQGIARVAIQDDLVPGLTPDDPVDEHTWIRARVALWEVFDAAARGETVGLDRLEAAVDDFIDALRRRRNPVFSLLADGSLDDGHLDHSLNVCLVSLVLGEARHYNHLDLHKLGLGAILHDVGKVALPPPNGPSQADPLRAHPEIGYEFLRARYDISILVAHVAFQHHEYLDGSGYPRGLRGSAIHEFGALAAVANACEHLLAGGRDPAGAVARLKAMAGRQLAADLVEEALRRIALYPVGTIVALGDGSIAVVTGQTHDAARPRLRVVADADHSLVDPRDVDLSQRPDLSIAAVLPDYPPRVRERAAVPGAGPQPPAG